MLLGKQIFLLWTTNCFALVMWEIIIFAVDDKKFHLVQHNASFVKLKKIEQQNDIRETKNCCFTQQKLISPVT